MSKSEKGQHIHKATVLADPPAWTHRNTTNSQYAFVGVSARPVVERMRIKKQAINNGFLPFRSEIEPSSVGAEVEVN